MTLSTIGIIGASTAGLAAAVALRGRGHDGRIVMIGAETHRPYDRPPLTKAFLAGQSDAERLAFPAAAEPGLDVEWRLGVSTTGMDVGTRTLALDDGSSLRCDGIVLACGSTPRTLPGASGHVGVHTIRTIEDAAALRADLNGRPEHVVVVGAGFIGCEVAATCRGQGIAVTLIDPLEAPLVRILGDEIGKMIGDLHQDHGVEVRFGVGVDGLEVDGSGRVARVRLSDGSVIETSVVVVGIGVTPNTGWLADSGLDITDGVLADATCTAAPGIVVAGDILRWPNPVFDGEVMRIEHWDHAFASAEHAAQALVDPGSVGPFAAVPWFWSDQYDRKVQLAGRPRPDDEMVVVDGALADRRFVALFGRGGQLTGVVGMNRPGHLIKMRPRVGERMGFDEARAVFA